MTLKENVCQSPEGGSRSPRVHLPSLFARGSDWGMLTVLKVDPVGELAEGSRDAWGWLVDARGVGVEFQLTGTSSVDVFNWVVVPPALRVELAWNWLVDTRGVGTVPGLTDGSSLTEGPAAACLVVSGVRPPLGEIWRNGEKPEKAIRGQRHVRRKTATFFLVYP